MSENTTAVAIKDEALLAALGEMANPEDKGDSNFPSVPVLKINSDPESQVCKPGEWVVGQKKDQKGDIAEEGKKVIGLVIIMVRNRFSYYNNKNTKLNCSSPLYLRQDPDFVKGNRLGVSCGKTCELRASDADPRCQGQKVCFGKALTEDGTFVDCVAYFKGTSWMPFHEYVEGAFFQNTKGGRTELPPFAFLTKLGSERQKNQGTIYYVAQFQRGDLLDMKMIQKFAADKEGVLKYIDAMNARQASYGEESRGKPVAQAAGSAPSPAPAAPAAQPGDEAIDVTPVSKTITPAMEQMGDMPAGFGQAGAAPEPSEEDADIEAAIAKALGKG